MTLYGAMLPETLQLFSAVTVDIYSTLGVPCSGGRQTHTDRHTDTDRETETYRERPKRSHRGICTPMGRKTVNKIISERKELTK